MFVHTPPVGLAAFRTVVAAPENAGRLFELIEGVLHDVSPGRTRYSEYGHLLAFAVRLYCQENDLPCHTSGGDGAFQIGEHVVAPDFAYRTTPMSDEYPDPQPPHWVVEIISPTDRAADIRAKRRICQEAGILLIELYPTSKSADVYAPGEPMRELQIDGGRVLPGFRLPLHRLFDERE